MIRSLFTCCLAVACVASSGCVLALFDSGQPGSGVIKAELRELDSFEKIRLSGFGDVTVEFGEESAIEITTDDNLLQFVTTEVNNEELRVGLQESIRPSDGLTFKITTPNLSQFRLSGAGDVNIVNYSGDKLRIDAAGAGSIKASGVAESLVLEMSGACNAKLSELVAKNADIEISGAGSATVNAIENLKVDISGACSVSYLGSPSVSKSVSGIGSVTQIGSSNIGQAEANSE